MPATLPKTGIDPAALLAIRDMELRARVVVEGLWSGLHRSPLEGFSVEFTEYRQYSPGDDLRYLDWRVLARSDREYIKKFEDETNLRCMLLTDVSRSMSFSSLSYSKAEYARTLCATFGYFLLQQRDVVGLCLFDDAIREFLPARWRPGHLRHLLALLSRKAEGRSTQLSQALQQLRPLCPKRNLIIIVSDFLTPPLDWETDVGQLVAAGHDVRALQILDPAEISLDYGEPALWQDLETGQSLYVDPAQAKEGYQKNFDSHQTALRQTFDRLGVPYQLSPTSQPLDYTLLDMMRAHRRSPNPRTAAQ